MQLNFQFLLTVFNAKLNLDDFFKVKEVLRKRCKAVASTHRSGKERRAYISSFHHALFIIAKVKE